MRSLAPLALVWLVSSASFAQGHPVYRAPPPRPAATAGVLERDAKTGNYRLTYTDEEGVEHTITVESADRVSFALAPALAFEGDSLRYSYTLTNTATSEAATTSLRLLTIPCDAPDAVAASTQWFSDVGVVKKISARKCTFSGSITTALKPGAAIVASVLSRWLPGIATLMVSGGATPPVWPSGEATPVAAVRLASTVNSRFVGGKTIDSVAPMKDPAQFGGPDHGVGLVVKDLSQSCQFAWVKTPGICNSLQVKLEHAQSAFLRGATQVARNELGAFLSELSALRGRAIEEAAYALLSTNVAYILNQM